MYICIYVYMYICIYVYMYIRIYVYTSELLLLPATNAQHIQLHMRMSCIASSAQHHSKHNHRRFGPSTTDWPSQQEAEAPQIDLSTTDQTRQQEAGASQIGPSSTDCTRTPDWHQAAGGHEHTRLATWQQGARAHQTGTRAGAAALAHWTGFSGPTLCKY